VRCSKESTARIPGAAIFTLEPGAATGAPSVAIRAAVTATSAASAFVGSCTSEAPAHTARVKAFGADDVHYRVCVRKPSGARRCKTGLTGESGEPSVKAFISSAVGTYEVTWKVGGRVVDRSHWVNVAEGV
jgi:hypothetical protein